MKQLSWQGLRRKAMKGMHDNILPTHAGSMYIYGALFLRSSGKHRLRTKKNIKIR